jgi:hypothetical protein
MRGIWVYPYCLPTRPFKNASSPTGSSVPIRTFLPFRYLTSTQSKPHRFHVQPPLRLRWMPQPSKIVDRCFKRLFILQQTPQAWAETGCSPGEHNKRHP